MISIVIMIITFVLSVIIILIPIAFKILKFTGLWFTFLYVLIVLILSIFIFKFTGNEAVTDYLNLGLITVNDYAMFGLYFSIGISGIFFVSNVVKYIFNFIEKIRGY